MFAINHIHPNFTRVDLPSLTIWFSYRTPIAFSHEGTITARENDWGPTTGKHLNIVQPRHDLRISGEAFQSQLEKAWQSVKNHEPSVKNHEPKA